MTNPVKKTTSDIAQRTAKLVREESQEFLKTARTQVTGSEVNLPSQGETPAAQSNPGSDPVLTQENQKDKVRSRKLREGLEAELRDIREAKEAEKERQKQAEAQRALQQEEPETDLPVTSKPGRKFLGGIKSHLERLKTKTEKTSPPSG